MRAAHSSSSGIASTGAHVSGSDARASQPIHPGLEVVHPLDPDWRLPVWIANFVLMDYGTGALFGVPAHDERDFEFATRYHLPIRRVVAGNAEAASDPIVEAETAHGIAVYSQFLDGLTSEEATAEVIRRAETAGWGKGTIAWRLRDGPNGVRAPAPCLGADTEAVLSQLLGYSPERIAALTAAGVIA